MNGSATESVTLGSELIERKVSLYSNTRDTEGRAIALAEIADGIVTGIWREQVEALRAERDDERRKEIKRTMAGFTSAGVFSHRSKNSIGIPSGFIPIDIDHLASPEKAVEVRDQLAADQHTLLTFVSPGGEGVKTVVYAGEVETDADFKAAWRAYAEYVEDHYSLALDPSGKDISRLCFVSYDPGAVVNLGEVLAFTKRKEIMKAETVPERSVHIQVTPGETAPTENRSAPPVENIRAALCHLDPAQPREGWLRICMAIKAAYPGKEGFTLFDEWSRRAPADRYGQTLETWNSINPDGGVTVGTLIAAAEAAGWINPQGRLCAEIRRAKADVEAQGVDSLEFKYGAPYFHHVNPKGADIYDGLNEAYFAGLHSKQKIELWEPDERMFYRYCDQSGLFAEVTTDLIKQEASSLILNRGRQDGVRGLEKDRGDRRLSAIVSQLKGIVEQRDAFKKTGRHIHLANGILDLSGDEPSLLPFSPDFRSRNQSPIAFDPTATCPRFMDELILPAVRPEDVAIIQKYMGLALLGRNIIQRLLILDGMEGRGKSQLSIVFQHLVGMVNCTQLRTEHLNERFELYRFLKKTLLAGVDVQADFLSARGAPVLKALVGGDIMDAEQKGGTGCFPIEGTFAVVITCNSRLRVRLEGDVGAWRRRLLIVRYEAPPPTKKIPDFGARLVETEGSGILNWAIQGLTDLLQDVERIGDIALTPRQARIVDSLLAESDSLRQFLIDRVERTTEGGDLSVHEIVEAYAEYCPTQGWSPLPITVVQRQIEGLMLELFQTVKVGSLERERGSAKGFRNVQFKALP